MNRLFIILTISLLTISAFATEQETDLLIIGSDTIRLKTFPLEILGLKFRPFGNTPETAPSTACWRGYRAIWRIVDNKLYLQGLIRCHSDRETIGQDIKELFVKNELEYIEEGSMIMANWVTIDLYSSHLHEVYFGISKDKSLKLRVIKGMIELNKIGQ
jgi:hypothetical protein